MKKNLLVALVVLVFLGCDSNQPDYMIPLDNETFRDSIFDVDKPFEYKRYEPSVVYFYSPRVLNCKKQNPMAEKAAIVYSYKIHFYCVNYEDNIKTAEALNIKKLPAFVFVPLNNQIQTISGAILSYEEFSKAMNEIFGIK